MMPDRYALIAIEGVTDQAVVERTLLQFFGFKKFDGQPPFPEFWKNLIPAFPGKNYYQRVTVPKILESEKLSVALYAAGGTNLKKDFPKTLKNRPEYKQSISAFAILADADQIPPRDVASTYRNAYSQHFPNFPLNPGEVANQGIRTGCFIFPNNVSLGVLESLLIPCGRIAYPKHIEKAEEFVSFFDESDHDHWAPFDKEKAITAAAASILRPGKTNAVTIEDNQWICPKTAGVLQQLVEFFHRLLDI